MKKVYILLVGLFYLGIGIGSAQYSVLHNFNDTNGLHPWGDVTLSGNVLYGMTPYGGIYLKGCIFSMNTDSSNYKDLHDFNDTSGANPYGNLTLSGGILYGMTSAGGGGFGCVFSIDTNGSSYSDILNFNDTNGSSPYGSLTLSGSTLYGMTKQGGVNGDGCIFSIQTNGNGYKDLFDFGGTTDVMWPYGNLTLSGGVLYGMTSAGGYLGNIFSIDTNGTGYRNLYNFDGLAGGNDPRGSLLLSGSVLYGMTSDGGLNDNGNIFSINTNGSGYNDLFDFDRTDGNAPNGSLILSGGVLYGMTLDEALYDGGTIFSINTDGSGFTTMHNFTDTSGINPYGSLILSGNVFYGMASQAASIGNGVIFSFKDSNLFSSIIATNYYCSNDEGTAKVNVFGGKPPYTYLWAPGGQTTDSLSGLTAAEYSVTVEDSSGSIQIDSVNIAQPVVLSVTTIMGNILCNGGLGSISSKGNGGAPPYTYTWSSGETNSNLTGLSIGTYSISITDKCGDVATAVVAITQPTALLANISASNSLICPGMPVTITVSATGGIAPYTYFWSTSSTTSTVTVIPIVKTTYTITVIDANGCGISDTLTIHVGCCNAYNEPICIATIDTATNKAKIIWGRTNSPPPNGYGKYIIYKYYSSFWMPIDSVALDSLSEYLDTASNPSAGPISYELATLDSCGNSPISLPHTTIYLTTTAGINAFILNWTAYVGFTPSKYRIFRGPALNAMVQIDSVASSILTYVDSFPPAGSIYLMEAVNPSGTCIPTHSAYHSGAVLSGSFSNGFNTATLGIQAIGSNVSKVNIYPNPNDGIFTLNYSLNGNANVRITIVNELGQIVYDNTKQKNGGNVTEQLNLENLASGIYSLRMQTDNSITVKKVVIMESR